MENRPVIKSVVDVGEEVCNRFRRFFLKQLDLHLSLGRCHEHHRPAAGSASRLRTPRQIDK